MGKGVVEDMHAFILAHQMALKAVIEKEGIECESELRRSWDVLLDAREAETAERELKELRESGFKGGVEVLDSVSTKYAATVCV